MRRSTGLEEFAADFVYSCAVCFHIHPDDIGFYFRALERITRKPGTILTFEVALADELFRYRAISWAWPLEFVTRSLPGLELAEISRTTETREFGLAIKHTRLKFQRPA